MSTASLLLLLPLVLLPMTDDAASPTEPAADLPQLGAATDLPPLPEATTSFGACTLGDDPGRAAIYVYGGNTGEAHGYDNTGQAATLRRLDLAAASPQWESLAEGEHLQGNALVAAGGRVVLLGGFKALNDPGDEERLQSLASVRTFDPAEPSRGLVADLPDLPEPRSSFDAVSDGQTIYVVGGWALHDGKETDWHTTAWKLDTAAADPAWQPLPTPPFQRRALVLALVGQRLFVIGGMDHESGPSSRVDVLDLNENAWSQVESLPGPPMAGFGAGALVADGRLFVTTMPGTVLRLDDRSWTPVGQIERGRFFHRVVAGGDGALLLGGTSMQHGKFVDLERLTLPR